MLEFLAAWWPVILCLLAGVALFVVEALMPGFGVSGVTGILVCLGAVIWAYLHHGVFPALVVLLMAIALCALAAFAAFRSLSKGKFKSIVLNDAESPEEGSSSPAVTAGQEGVALTVLRPAGIVRIGENKLNAVTEGDFIAKDSPVRVTAVRGSTVVVSEKTNS